jgi:hypothetical protein
MIVANNLEKEIFVPNSPVTVHVVYANTKAGTAHEVYAECETLIFSGTLRDEVGIRAEESKQWDRLMKAWLWNARTDIVTDRDIAGHDKSHFCLARTLPLEQDEAKRLKNENDVIYVMAAVRWKDETGQYNSAICSFFLPKEATTDPKAPLQWRGCLTGHNFTRQPFRLPAD